MMAQAQTIEVRTWRGSIAPSLDLETRRDVAVDNHRLW
jgi:hypothetical protein